MLIQRAATSRYIVQYTSRNISAGFGAGSLNTTMAVFEISRDAHLCNVPVKVSRLVDSTVVFERPDEHTYTRYQEEPPH